MESVRRLHTVLGHINGHAEEPLWVALMDAGHNPVSKPRYGCRCSAEKWQYVCKCYPCLRRAGREEDFDWTPDIIGAQPQFIPPQWRSKAGLRAVACAGDLPRPSPKRQPELVTSEGATPRMRLPDVPGAPWAPPFGPVAIGALPRFAGMATFARLPQLQELRSLQAARTAVLRLRPKEAKSGALARLRGGAMGDFEAIGEEVSLSVSEEHSNLEVELQGMQATLALWTLPDAWHRHIFEFPSPNGKISRLEMEIFLEKRLEQFDIALVGVPFDTGCSFRPGARFGPEAIRSNSRLTRPYLIAQQQRPLQDRQVVDTGDVFATPFNIDQAVQQIYEGCKERLQMSRRLVVFGGDHTLSYPSIKAVAERFGPVVLVHFDSHLDTFPKLWGQDVWHGAPFRNCWAEGLLAREGSTHIGIRATTYSADDFHDSDAMGIATLTAEDVHEKGVEACVDVVRRRWQDSGGAPVYLSVDIDVLDPSVAPGTGTPEFGGLLAHQLLQFIRGLKGLPIVAADVVEVAPAYDHAGITSMAAANVMLEQIGLISSCMDSDGFTS
ncbi:unnamed protein product [Durusdinium trenchii]|uniref:Guanidinobutyrase (GBase) (D-arginase) n=2 Tax=Durusdinium trenchii TaxID=1381693 RepID=A0ABP0S7W9_9DINO